MILTAVSSPAQTHTEDLSRELAFEIKNSSSAIWLANINGSIRAEGYAGDKVILEARKKISAKTEERLERAKKEVGLGVIDRADTIIVYIQGICGSFSRHPDKQREGGWPNAWGYDWNNCREEYDYRFDFVLKVPADVNVILSTVNDGEIEVSGVSAGVRAHNVNGSIRLTGLAGPTDAYTINGDVTLDYSRNPVKDCRYYTLNGDINALFQKGLGATFSFQSYNGSLYSNLEPIQPLPVELEKTQGEKGIQFKVSSSRYKVGPGGARLDFETFNGDVYLKEKSN
jgi:hypothetical protein